MAPSNTATKVAILGLTVETTARDKGLAAIARDLGHGYNDAGPGEPGFWTWETLATDVYTGLGLAFKSTDTARATGRLAGSMLRGLHRNGARYWSTVKADAETTATILAVYVAAYAIHAKRAEA